MASYSDVQFIGYTIPTIPLDISDVGDPNGSGFVEGRYIGIDPPNADIDARIALVMNAVRQTLKSGAVDGSASTLKIFVVPEFSFRGTRGAYNDDPPDVEHFTYFRTAFAKQAADPAYQDWLFVIGTVVSTEGDYVPGQDPKRDLEARVREDLGIALGNVWQFAHAHQDKPLADVVFKMLVDYTNYSHANPIYEVTDRCFVVAGGEPDSTYPDGLSIQKKFVSNEDFVLNLYSNVFAEEDEAFPAIDEKKGEDKQSAFDDLSIFTIAGIKFGVEICLDHANSRLRRNRVPDTEVVQIHLVPSCGMQIAQESIIAGAGGLVFNCDGQYDHSQPGSLPGADDSLWTFTASRKAHSQLTQVVTPCSGNDPSSNMATVVTPSATVTAVPIEDASASKLYAYGPGEVHVYTPLQVPQLGTGGGAA